MNLVERCAGNATSTPPPYSQNWRSLLCIMNSHCWVKYKKWMFQIWTHIESVVPNWGSHFNGTQFLWLFCLWKEWHTLFSSATGLICFPALPNVCKAVVLSSHNFCSVRWKVTSLFSGDYNVNLFTTVMSDNSGVQIVVIMLTWSLRTGQKDNESTRIEDVGKNKIRFRNTSS